MDGNDPQISQISQIRRALFRPEALDAPRNQCHGEIILVRPVSSVILTYAGVLIAAGMVALSVCGTYTKHSTLKGQIAPDQGLIKVYVPQYGVIVERRVTEGQTVAAGEILYMMSSERFSSVYGETQQSISNRIRERERSLREEVDHLRELERRDRTSAAEQIAGFSAELQKLKDMRSRQAARVQMSQASQVRYRDLSGRGFVSQEQRNAKEEDLLDQRARLQDIERDEISIGRQLQVQQAQLAELPVKYQQQLATVVQSIAAAEQELADSESKRRLVITAPAAGTATGVIGETGQAVDLSRPLLSIVPAGANLRADLYAPSRAVGFVKTGDQVVLSYEAYPYEKFGHWRGTVTAVSKTALATAELTSNGRLDSGGSGVTSSEPQYLITVRLESQTIMAYGQLHSLQPGMAVEGDVLQDTRRLYEWVLEPLYALTGKLH